MITRFRIEAENKTQADLIEELAFAVSLVISTFSRGLSISQLDGKWECTQDVTIKSEDGYKGRMVMKYHLNEED